MLAWILNTKPVRRLSSGSTVRSRAARGSGPGACAVNAASNSSHAEVVDGGAEEHRSLPAGAIGFRIEGLGGALDQLDLLVERARRDRRGTRAPAALCKPIDGAVLADPALLAGLVGVDPVLEQVIDARAARAPCRWAR